MKFRYLIGIPCLYGATHTRMSIESVSDIEGVDLLLIDNGAEQSVKDIINEFAPHPNVTVIHNDKNIYVNPAWNQILEHFLTSENNYDYVLIMNSDLGLNKNWVNVLDEYLTRVPYAIPYPVVTDDPENLTKEVNSVPSETELTGGVPGVLIVLHKKHARKVYPIPDVIKVWFGDNWIFLKLRNTGYKIFQLDNFLAYNYHNGSQNVNLVEGIKEIIENDKQEWEKIKHGVNF